MQVIHKSVYSKCKHSAKLMGMIENMRISPLEMHVYYNINSSFAYALTWTSLSHSNQMEKWPIRHQSSQVHALHFNYTATLMTVINGKGGSKQKLKTVLLKHSECSNMPIIQVYISMTWQKGVKCFVEAKRKIGGCGCFADNNWMWRWYHSKLQMSLEVLMRH